MDSKMCGPNSLAPPDREQVNNTCYLNSVLQTLYFCQPFRRFVLEYHENYLRRHPDGSLPSAEEDTLLLALSDLFHQIATQKRRAGSIAPRRFIAKLRKENGAGVSLTSLISSAQNCLTTRSTTMHTSF